MSTLAENSIDRIIEPAKPDATKSFEFFPLLALLSLTLISVAIIGPQGEFSSNDDHIYTSAVKGLVQFGSFITGGSNAFDFVPIYVAAFVCKLLGFSYQTLRCTTIAFDLFGIIGLYLALRELSTKPRDAAILSAVYAFNPFMVNLSISFMTDVPALALTNWSLFTAVAAIKRGKLSFLLLSICFLTMAMSVRQTALFVAVPIVVLGMLSSKKLQDKILFGISLLIPILSYICLQNWLASVTTSLAVNARYTSGMFKSFGQELMNPFALIETVAKGLCYLGLALAPLVAVLPFGAFRAFARNRIPAIVALAVSFVICAIPLANMQLKGAFMPYSLNLFLPPILGSYCLVGGVPTWGYPALRGFTYASDLAAFLTCLCLTLVAALAGKQLLRKADSDKTVAAENDFQSKISLFLVLLLFSTLGALIVQLKASNLDRYYLMALAPLILVLAPLWNEFVSSKIRIAATLLLIGLAVYSTLATLDYMNFSRAGWQSVEVLRSKGVPARHIDGGPSYIFSLSQGYFSSAYQFGSGWPDKLKGTEYTSKYRWWPIFKEEYIVGTIKLDGYHEASCIKYWSPLRWKYMNMYTLEKNAQN